MQRCAGNASSRFHSNRLIPAYKDGFEVRLIDNEGLPGFIVRWRTDSPRNSMYFIFTLLNELRQEVLKTFSLMTRRTPSEWWN